MAAQRRGAARQWWSVAALLILGPAPSLAADLFVSRQQAQDLCSRDGEWCLGFVTGALDGWAALESYYPGERYCLPPAETAAAIRDRFVAGLSADTTETSTPAAYFLFEMLIAAFPCGAGLSPTGSAGQHLELGHDGQRSPTN